jgi:hypothetical protein
MQQPSGLLPHCSSLFGTRCTSDEGRASVGKVLETLLPFLVVRPREACLEKGFDRVPRVTILRRSPGPPHDAVLREGYTASRGPG